MYARLGIYIHVNYFMYNYKNISNNLKKKICTADIVGLFSFFVWVINRFFKAYILRRAEWRSGSVLGP